MPPGAGKKEAEAKEAELKQALARQQFTDDPPLSAVMALYMKHADSLRSSDTAKHHAARIAEFIDGHTASEAQAVSFKIIEGLKDDYQPATINRSLGTLTKALSLAWRSNQIPVNYGEKIERLKVNNQRTTTLTLKEVELLASKASETVRTAIWIAIYTGMRRGEILKLEQAHIQNDMILIPAGNTKTLKMRAIPVVKAVKPWLKKVPLGINYEGLKTGFARARMAAGMPHVTFHDLRRSCGSLMVQSGVDIYVVSRILGHSSVQVTQTVYAHLKVDQLRSGLEQAFGKGKK